MSTFGQRINVILRSEATKDLIMLRYGRMRFFGRSLPSSEAKGPQNDSVDWFDGIE